MMIQKSNLSIALGLSAVLALGIATRRKVAKTEDVGSKVEEDPNSVVVSLPSWASEEIKKYKGEIFETDEQMMKFVIHLSARNVAEGTGGPFGSAIFERTYLNDGSDASIARLVSVGVNRVVPLSNSTLHGETVAIQMAQKKIGNFSLRNVPNAKKKIREFELFTSCEPCAMCLGATLWSGVSRIVCAATKDDAQAIGFDEGPVFEQSYQHLRDSGIAVTKNVLREEGAKVLRKYAETGLIYNADGE